MTVDKVQEEGKQYGVNVEKHEGVLDLENVKFLVYAESGVGKTVFAATWPSPVFLDLDKGMASVRTEAHRIAIDTWSDAQEAYMFLDLGEHDFRTVVVDSLNELQYVSMRHVIDTFPAIRRSYEDLASQSDYGKMLDIFDKFVRAIRSLSLNVVFIANVAKHEFETDVIQPQFVGKNTARNLARMMDVVGYMYKSDSGESTQTRVMVLDAANYVTKDRSDKLPPTIVDPTYERLNSYWTDSLDRNKGE